MSPTALKILLQFNSKGEILGAFMESDEPIERALIRRAMDNILFRVERPTWRDRIFGRNKNLKHVED